MSDPSTASRSRAWVEVRLDRLRQNALAAQRALGPGMGLVPMVKADAYGLGLGPVASTLAGLNPWAFGVAAVAEGEALRALGWRGRVLVFSPTPPEEYPRAGAAGLTLCLSDLEGVRRWAGVAASAGRPLAFHVEVDTGMGRAGFPWAEAGEWGEAVARAAGDAARWEGVYTHFHSADEPDLASTDRQWERFRAALAALPAPRGEPLRVHAANSAATLRRAGFHCDLARPGIYLYGGSAGPGVRPGPVVSLRARVVLVREVPAGSTLGYGATYAATKPERWGTLAIGYGDGLRRALGPGGGHALVHGRRVPVIGRISMDVTTVDLTEVPDVTVGEVATLIGEDGEGAIPLDEVAARCGTISYEILTGLTARLPRVYLPGAPPGTGEQGG